jgi:hypothetical protein
MRRRHRYLHPSRTSSPADRVPLHSPTSRTLYIHVIYHLTHTHLNSPRYPSPEQMRPAVMNHSSFPPLKVIDRQRNIRYYDAIRS